MSGPLALRVHDGRLAVARLDAGAAWPPWALEPAGPLHTLSRSATEASVVTLEAAVPADRPAERGFRALEVAGPLDFSLVGILARLAGHLAEADVSIFAVSTHDTDWILVREDDLATAVTALRAAGCRVDD